MRIKFLGRKNNVFGEMKGTLAEIIEVANELTASGINYTVATDDGKVSDRYTAEVLMRA